ncbi:MAG TPA: hypothetical protein VGZ03_05750 [Acidimicrobiales bacterium]|nr:hypothetical protein [Acidimicrobiales bacterium]
MDATGLIDATAAPVYELGGAFCFTEATAARGERLGLDVFMFYCLGRGGVLGDVDAATVADAFIWFKPQLVETWWNEGRAVAKPTDVAVAYLEAARDYARRTFKETATLRAFADAAARVVDGAPTGRWPLVDGYRRYALPDDVVGRAFQLVVTLRELRGGAYGEAVAALGITPAESHFLNSADAFELYGYESDDTPTVTDELVERRALAEDRATELLVATYDVLDDDARLAFLDGVRELAETADVDVEDVAD